MKQRGKQASVAKFLATKLLLSTEGGWRWKGGFVTTTSVGCGKFLLFFRQSVGMISCLFSSCSLEEQRNLFLSMTKSV
jgi:hypothetical protein